MKDKVMSFLSYLYTNSYLTVMGTVLDDRPFFHHKSNGNVILIHTRINNGILNHHDVIFSLFDEPIFIILYILPN
jgi:hypothetical protein